MKYKIPFIKPHFPNADDLVNDFREIRENNWFTNFGPFEKKLCSKISDIYQSKSYVTTIANATLGIQAAVDILLDNNNDKKEIIIPSFTFAAGPEVLIKSGFKPVFIDIEKDSWQPSFEQAAEYLRLNSQRVGGLLLCNIFGVGNKQIDKWESLAVEYAIPLIIDSAAGFGSLYSESEKIGLRGDCEIFSMHATKPFSVGEGGLVISKNPDFIKQVRSYQNFGFDETRNIGKIGTNAKLQELNCAIGVRQLDNFESRLKSRRNTLSQYKEFLEPLGFEFMQNDDLSTVCFASVLAPTSETATDVYNALNEGSVEVRRYYTPLHMQKMIMDYSTIADNVSITENVFSRILSLPVHDGMLTEEIMYIKDIVNKRLGL